jgi:hypothetical protein
LLFPRPPSLSAYILFPTLHTPQEGLFTLVVGIASFFMLPPSPSQTKSRWRPNGLFTDHEVKIIVNRVARDDPTKLTMHNRQALTPKLLWASLKDYDLWPMCVASPSSLWSLQASILTAVYANRYLIGFAFQLPSIPAAAYFQVRPLASSSKPSVRADASSLLYPPTSVATLTTSSSRWYATPSPPLFRRPR